ncbi:MAG: 3-oxoacyl-ACP reductase FabG [Planctomycetota bacterium]|nr:3-oxoacyl-ACP reductase FabG [Planctomycetota bacterium]
MNFTGKVAVVTGGARGIGKAISKRLSDLGADVAILGRNVEAAQAFAAELSAGGRRAKGYACDISDAKQVDAAIEEVVKDFGKIDVLVNNAGITQDGLLMRMSDEAWSKVLETNLTGVFRAIRAVARPMLKARSGAIVNIGSVVGLIGNAGQANYCAAKAGLIGLTQSAAREFGPRGVRVNAVAPGLIETDMTANLSDDQKKGLTGNLPLGRAGKPEDVAGVVAFLAGDDAAYITGQVLAVDGGMVM